jgi:hypothetical protein
MNPMRRWRIIVCLLLVALSGAVIGGAATHWWMTRQTPETDTAALRAARLQHFLALDAAQTERVRVIFRERLAEAAALPPMELEPRLALRSRLVSELRAVFTPEQRARFDALQSRTREPEPSP